MSGLWVKRSETMKKQVAGAIFLFSMFLFSSCGAAKNDAPRESAAYAQLQAQRQAIAMDSASLVTNWAGAGFAPEAPPSADGKAASAYTNMAKSPAGPAPSEKPEQAAVDRKLVKSSSVQVKVEDLNKASAAVSEMMQALGAYSSSTQIEEYRQEYTIRVPASRYDAMIKQVNSLGKVLSRSDSVEDVTLQFYDLEGRFNTRKELLKTYQNYLGRAKNIEEILSVEKKISELQNEIDWYGSQLTRLADLVDYATINLTLQGPSPSYDYYEPGVLDRIKDLFENFGDFLSGAAVVIVGIIIYGIPILALAAFAYWLLFGKVGLLRKLWRILGKKKE